MLRIKINWNTPFKGCSRNTKILKTWFQEVIDHFILSTFRLNEMRMIFNILDQTIRILTHLEEICFFLHFLQFTTTDRTFTIFCDLRLCIECFTFLTIQTIIMTLINITLVIELLKDLLHLLFMIWICCSHEFIIRNIHNIKLVLDFLRYFINKCLRRNTSLCSLFFNFLAMFIRTSLETNIIAYLSFIAGNCIC